MININCYLHADFSQIRQGMLSIPNYFEKFEGSLRTGRDEVKAYTVDSLKFVVTAFGRVTLANHLSFCFARKSKAQIAYENSLELRMRDVIVPQPVGYIEQASSLRLLRSFFISCLVDYKPIAELLLQIDDENKSQLFVGFTKFLYSLHQKGVFHHDLNVDNVLCKKTDEEYEFCLFDNTRVEFKKPTKKRVLNNLAEIELPLELYAFTIAEYAKLTNHDPYALFDRLLTYRNKRGRR